VYMCMYTHLTHTLHVGYTDVGPGVGTRHLETRSPNLKNPDGTNLSRLFFVYVYKVHICICMLGGRMRSWTKFFFFLKNILSFRKQKAKDLNVIPKTRMHMDLSYIDLTLRVDLNPPNK